MSFLFSYGISSSKAFRIHKKYGDKAIEVVQRDPYCLARDIRGIGFLQSDNLAMKLAIKKDSSERLRAGLEFSLSEVMQQGHCGYSKNDLLSKTAELLKVDIIKLEDELKQSVNTKQLIEINNYTETSLIYLPNLYQSEFSLANRIKEINNGNHPCPKIDFDKALKWVENKSGFKLEESQSNALKNSINSKVSIITGGPGVGKTTIIKSLIMILQAKKMRVLCCAPTGRAAKRMSESTNHESKTIHRLLQYNPGTGGFIHGKKNPLECDVLIIDESSMIDVLLAEQLMNAVPLHSAVVFVGDIDQLPSVGPGRVLQDIILSKQFNVSELKEVFRQAKESNIITNAHIINQGKVPEFDKKDTSSDCYFIEMDDPKSASELIVKLSRESIPKKFGVDSINDIQVLSPMQKGDLGARNLNLLLQKALNSEGIQIERFGVTYRVGDRVMQTENDYDKDVYNGDLGYIERIDHQSGEVFVKFEERSIVYDAKELDSLLHAYSITIHKSQVVSIQLLLFLYIINIM